jgi:SAM-dependent methyltransferase
MFPDKDTFYASVSAGDPGGWAAQRSPELWRIFTVFGVTPEMSGPTLDIGSSGASFYRPIRDFRPNLLPYTFTDLNGADMEIDGEIVRGISFECDRDRLPFADRSMGLVLLCDVIEHLLVDPVWTLLEINRVLRDNGHLVISTPNVAGIDRAVNIFQGRHPGTEHQYKPTSVFCRHNREWTPSEIVETLLPIGFTLEMWESNHDSIPKPMLELLGELRRVGVVTLEDRYFGPDLVFVMKKVEHLTVDSPLSKDRRWPVNLYTGYDTYRQRPERFPILKPSS